MHNHNVFYLPDMGENLTLADETAFYLAGLALPRFAADRRDCTADYYAADDRSDARRMRGLEIARQKGFTPAERLTMKDSTSKNVGRSELLAVMRVVAGVLEAPRDRLGRLDIPAGDEAQLDREALRNLAVAYEATPSRDIVEQCAKVLRCAIAKIER